MPSLTERERAKRAKMVARFNASKTNRISDASGLSGLDASALSLDVLASPKTEKKDDAVVSSPRHEMKDSGKLDDYLSKKEGDPMQIVDGSDEQAERAVAVCEEFTVSSPEPAPRTFAQMESPMLETATSPDNSTDYEVGSELPLSIAPPFVEDKPKPLSVNTIANKTTLSVEIPQTPTKNPPQSRSTPRSRRNTSIADAKKMLAAARKVSSSPKPSSNNSALKEHAKEMECKLDQEEKMNEIEANVEVKESVAAINRENQMEPLPKEEERNENSLLQENTDHEIPTKTLVTNSPSSSRLEKVAKIRARSPHLIHRHKGVSVAMATEEEKGGAKKRLSDEYNDVLRRVPTPERWSDEFNTTSDRPLQSDDGSDGQRLSYDADTRLNCDKLNSYGQGEEGKSQRMSNDLSSQRPSIESTNSDATGSTLVATDNRQHQDKKSKIASKAKQYRKWQQRNSTTTKEEAQSDVSCYHEESKESFGSYQVNMQSDGYLFEPKPQASGLVDKVGDMFEPRPQYKSEYNVHQIYEPECPLTPSQMAYLYENQEYHVDDEQTQIEYYPGIGSQIADVEREMPNEQTTLLMYAHDADAEADIIDPVVAPEPAILLMSPQGQSEKSFFSASEPSTKKSTTSIEKLVNVQAVSQYKTLLPSKSDASKELSLNQLTISVSEAQSFVPAQQGSSDTPKLAGEAFLTMSKDTETPHPSNDFDDDQFQSNFDWPVEAFSPTSLDAFSPTSWGAGQLGPSSSGDSKWESNVPDTPDSLTAPVTEEERVGWDFKATSPAVVWGDAEEKNAAPTKDARERANPGSAVEWDEAGEEISTPTMKADSSLGGIHWNNEQISAVDERDDIMNEEARVEAEARIGELAGLELEPSVDRYEGFGEVEHRDCPSRMESRDGPSPREQSSDDLSPGIESRFSEGTEDTATEFDPISLFGAAEEGSFPACGAAGNDASAVSWTSTKILKANDDSTNSAFPSLHAGNPMDASTQFGQKSAAQTHTEGESLESWWHSRQIPERDNNINAAVRDALNEILSQEEQRSDKATERCEIDQRCNSESETPKQPRQHSTEISQDPLSARAKRYSQNRLPSPDHDDDSIFGDLDLDDSSVGNARQHSSSAKKNKSRRKSSLSKTITSNAETDIFSGVSMNSRQVNQRKAIPMKSLLDGSTTTGSQCMNQKTKTSSKGPGSLPKVEKKDIEPMGLFMMDGTYGVINVNGKTSPSSGSVTSDITTSVIFGGHSDYGKKRSFSKRGPSRSMSIEKDIPEFSVEIPDVISDKPVCSPHNRHSGARDRDFVNEDTENIDPQGFDEGGATQDVKEQNKMRSLISDTTTDEATQESNPTLLKKALMMVKNGKNFVEDSAKRKCELGNTPSETVGEARPSILLLPLALPLACGMLGASSFAYCASKGCTTTDSNSADMMNMQNACSNDTDENLEEDSFDQLAFRDSQSNVHEYTVGSNRGLVDLSNGTDKKNYQDSQTDVLAENEDRTLVFEEGTIEGEQTLNTNEPTISTYDPTVASDEESSNEDESDYEDSDCTEDENEEGAEITDIVPLSELEMNKLKDWESKDYGFAMSPRSKKTLQQEQSRAYEKLLFYAYTALTVPLPNEVVEKGEDMNTSGVEFPLVLSPRGAELRSEAMKLLLKRLGEDGMEVLKLNRERKWQSKFLTITKEVVWFKKSDDIRYNKIDCCPQGLLWVKKFNGHSNEHSVDAIGNSGKGGIMFSSVKSVSVTTDNFTLSKKQKKGMFKDSFTFVLHTEVQGKKRDILFRCGNKDDICTLSSGFQAIIDRINNETVVVPKPLKSQLDKLPMTEDQAISPVAITKPFSPKATYDDRWEV